MPRDDDGPDRGPSAAPATPATPATPAAPAAPPPVTLPGWFEVGLLFVVAAAVWCGGTGLALAVAGHYSVGVATGVGLALAVLTTVAGARALVAHRGGDAVGDVAGRPTVVAVVLALLSAAWDVWRSGTWINIDRDPGAYAMTARWISEHHTLTIPFETTWTSTDVPVSGSSSAVYTVGDHLEFQFDHLLPALLAQVRDLAGDRAMLSANAAFVALGLLAVYAVGVRLTGRPWLVLLTVGALGLSMPVLYVARASFSEGVTMLLVWAGVWLLTAAWDRAPVRLGLLGGFALGATIMARVDSLIYLLVPPLLVGLVAIVRVGRPERRRVTVLAASALLGAAAPAAVGTIDLLTRTGQYYDGRGEILVLQLATVFTIVVGAVAVVAAGPLSRLVTPAVRWLTTRRDRIGRVTAVVVVAVFVFAWALRPGLQHPTGKSNSTTLEIQRLEHLPIQPARLYDEQSVVWLSWYLGPVAVALAILGLGVLVLQTVRARPAAVIVFAVAGAGTALYLYSVQNTPDQLFGMRRFVPVTMPLFALATAVALAAVPRRLPDGLRGAVGAVWDRWFRPAVVIVLVLVVAFPVGTGWRVRDFSQRLGSIAMFDDTCAALGPDAAVLFPVPSYASTSYPQVIRDYCGVPAAVASDPLTAATARTLADAWHARGRTLWLVDSDPDSITTVLGLAAGVTELGHAVNRRELASTLSRPATEFRAWDQGVFGTPVPR